MHLDWYDRGVLTFVLGCSSGAEPSDDASLAQFGITAPRVMRRFDAVLDAARPGQFIGLRLTGATHGDFSQSTNPLVQAGMNLFGGQPTAVNTQA